MWRKFTVNSLGNLATTLVISTSGIVLSIIMARAVDPVQYGRYVYAIFIVATADVFLGFGLPQTVTRFVAEYVGGGHKSRALALVRYSLAIRLGAAVVLGLILFASGSIRSVAGLEDRRMVAVVVAILVPTVLLGLQRATLSALLRTEIVAIVLAITLLFKILAIATLSQRTDRLLVLLTPEFIATLAASLLLVRPLLRALGNIADKPTAVEQGARDRVVRYSAALALIAMMDYVVWARSEVLFIEHMRSSSEVAYYAVAAGIPAAAMSLIPMAIGSSITPMVAQRSGANDSASICRVVEFSARVMTIVILPLAVGGCILSSELVHVVYGSGYDPAIRPMQIAFIGAAIPCWLGIASSVLYGLGIPGFAIRLGLALLPVSLILNIGLIHRFGITGAALANAMTQALAIPFMFRYLGKHIDVRWPWSNNARAAAATGLMGAALLLIRSADYSPIETVLIALPLGIVVYCSAALILRVVTREEIHAGLRFGRSLSVVPNWVKG